MYWVAPTKYAFKNVTKYLQRKNKEVGASKHPFLNNQRDLTLKKNKQTSEGSCKDTKYKNKQTTILT